MNSQSTPSEQPPNKDVKSILIATLRDKIAVAALQSLLAIPARASDPVSDTCQLAYTIADIMITMRKTPTQSKDSTATTKTEYQMFRAMLDRCGVFNGREVFQDRISVLVEPENATATGNAIAFVFTEAGELEKVVI